MSLKRKLCLGYRCWGDCVANMVLKNMGMLEVNNMLSIGEKFISACYELAGLEKPAWLSARYEEKEDPYEYIIEEFVEKLKRLVNDLYTRYVSCILESDPETLRTSFIAPD